MWILSLSQQVVNTNKRKRTNEKTKKNPQKTTENHVFISCALILPVDCVLIEIWHGKCMFWDIHMISVWGKNNRTATICQCVSFINSFQESGVDIVFFSSCVYPTGRMGLNFSQLIVLHNTMIIGWCYKIGTTHHFYNNLSFCYRWHSNKLSSKSIAKFHLKMNTMNGYLTWQELPFL